MLILKAFYIVITIRHHSEFLYKFLFLLVYSLTSPLPYVLLFSVSLWLLITFPHAIFSYIYIATPKE